jgi:hypothetical protein
MFVASLGGRRALTLYAEHCNYGTGAIDVLIGIFKDNVELCKKLPQEVLFVLIKTIAAAFSGGQGGGGQGGGQGGDGEPRRGASACNKSVLVPAGVTRTLDFLMEVMSPHGQPLKENQDRLMNVVFADKYTYLRILYEDETPTKAAVSSGASAEGKAAMAAAAAAPFTRVQEDQARKARVENTVGYKAREALIERAERFISDGATEAERLDQRLAESQVMTSARSLAVE